MEAGLGVESLLTYNPYLTKEVWTRMQRWYKDAANLPPPPSAERLDLYIQVPPLGSGK